jgi:hypothetical protein
VTQQDSGAVYDEAAEMIERYRVASPDVAAAFVQMLDRIRTDAAWTSVAGTTQQMAAENSINGILRRQARAMDELHSGSQKLTLLPSFTGSNFRRLEKAVVDLLPSTVAEVSEIERIAAEASTDPQSRTLINRIATRLPDRSEIAGSATWVGFYAVCVYLTKMAPEINANTIAMLGVLVAVWAVLAQRRSS